MTPRAARTVAICRRISYAVMIAAVIAVIPTRMNWFWAIFIVFAVSLLQSRQVLVSYVPLRLPGFDDQVAGLMLGGMSEEAAVVQVSRGMAGASIFMLFPTVLLCLMLDIMAYGITFNIGLPPDVIGTFVAHAALWLVGGAFVCVALPLVLIPLSLHAAKRKRP